MPQIVLTDAVITVNSVALSSRTNQVTLNYEVEPVEVTAFGDNTRKFTGGLANVTCDIELQQDFAAANVEATVYPLVGQTTTVTIKPTSAATSSTNPIYTLSGTFLGAHTPVNASVGELSTTSLSFQGGSLAKATT